jgi:RNA polymerase sigma factor (sigma-70 family)
MDCQQTKMADVMSAPARSAEGMSDEESLHPYWLAKRLSLNSSCGGIINVSTALYGRSCATKLRPKMSCRRLTSAPMHLDQFAGRASFSTWLIRIAVHEGMARLHSGKGFEEEKGSAEREGDRMDRLASPLPSPEQQASASKIKTLLEALIDRLPDGNRAVFVMRDVEGMTTTETADALGVTEENVKVRFHRARAALRRHLPLHAIAGTQQAFAFHAARCDRIVTAVLQRIDSKS